MKYRLEITEKKNGKKRYVPQVSIGRVESTWWGSKVVTRWENIIMGYPSMSTYDTSGKMIETWGTEEEALSVIEGHKEKIRIRNGETLSNVTYKAVE